MFNQKLSLIGQRYGKLLVESSAPSRNKRTNWHCSCSCGNEVTVSTSNLRSGNTRSCGCGVLEAKTKHGEAQRDKSGKAQMSRIYRIWANMKHRCTKASYRDYQYYGGRGIKVCEEWLGSFEAFRNWAISNGYVDNLTIDRRDNDGNYSPDNCHWVTRKEQNQNRRKSTNVKGNRTKNRKEQAK